MPTAIELAGYEVEFRPGQYGSKGPMLTTMLYCLLSPSPLVFPKADTHRAGCMVSGHLVSARNGPCRLLQAAWLGRRALFERLKQTLGSVCRWGLLTRPLVSLWGTEEHSRVATVTLTHQPSQPRAVLKRAEGNPL